MYRRRSTGGSLHCQTPKQLRGIGRRFRVAPHPRKCAEKLALLVLRGTSPDGGPLGGNSPHRIEHSIGRIHALEIFGHFRAQEPASHRMRRITLDLCRPPVFDGDQNAAGIRTIVRASGVNDLLHGGMIIKPARVSPGIAGVKNLTARRKQRTPAAEAECSCKAHGTRSRALPEEIIRAKPDVVEEANTEVVAALDGLLAGFGFA